MGYEEIIEEIKSKVDIVDLISNYVDLKRAGQNLKGLCPFHQERTPSFTVNPSKQIFYCFGCHKGGDHISFIMAYENVSFNEALMSLCEMAGIRPDASFGPYGSRDIFFKINKEAVRFYHNQLLNNQRAMGYLRSRAITDETIENYELGYSPAERDSLLRHLIGQGFKQEDIVKVGLANIRNGQPLDFFRDRIMFPIVDLNAKVLSFGGRALSEQTGTPKYINTAESPVFKKREALFGLHKAKHAISQKGYSAVVEGYMDVLMCHQHGFFNVVAPLGTAITEAHLRRLKKYSNNILVVFDGDKPGITAAKRALELALSQSMNVKISLLPNAEDPDSILKKQGAGALAEVFSRALSLVSFCFKLYGKDPVDFVRKTLSVLLLSEDRLQREEAIKELADKSGINELSIRHEMNKLSDVKKNPKKARSEVSISLESNKTEEFFLRTVLCSPAPMFGSILSKLREIDLQYFNDPTVKNLLKKLLDFPYHEKGDLIEGLLKGCDIDERELLLRVSVDEPLEYDKACVIAEDCLRKIALKAIERKMKEATQCGNIELLNRLLMQKRELSTSNEQRAN